MFRIRVRSLQISMRIRIQGANRLRIQAFLKANWGDIQYEYFDISPPLFIVQGALERPVGTRKFPTSRDTIVAIMELTGHLYRCIKSMLVGLA